MDSSVREKLAACTDLPSLPKVAIELLTLCNHSEPDMVAIAELIGSDPALSMKLLRVANSPVYRGRSEVRTVKQAIFMLGLSAISPLAVSFSLVQDARPRGGRSSTWYWKRSLLTAVAARELSQSTGFLLGDEAFLAGLIQDIGILALRQLHEADYAARAPDGAGHAALIGTERGLFGEDHASIGAWLAERWHMPAILCTAIRYSHAPESVPDGIDVDHALLVRIVAVAAEVAELWIEGDPSKAITRLRKLAHRYLDLSAAQVDEVVQKVARRSGGMARLFEMDIGSTQELVAIADEANEAVLEEPDFFGMQSVDSETGLPDRNAFEMALACSAADADRGSGSVSLVLLAVDGGPEGPSPRELASMLAGRLRPTDFLAFIGDETFAILLPGTPPDGARVVAGRISMVLSVHGTVSVGQASHVRGDPALNLLRNAESILREVRRR